MRGVVVDPHVRMREFKVDFVTAHLQAVAIGVHIGVHRVLAHWRTAKDVRAPVGLCRAESESRVTDVRTLFPLILFGKVFLDVVRRDHAHVRTVGSGLLDFPADGEQSVVKRHELKIAAFVFHRCLFRPRIRGGVVHVEILFETHGVVESRVVVVAGDVHLAFQTSGGAVTAWGGHVGHGFPRGASTGELFNLRNAEPIVSNRSPAAHHVDGVAGARHATVLMNVAQARRRGRTSREIVILGRFNRVLSRIDAARDDDSIDESRRSTRERARAEARPRRDERRVGGVRLTNHVVLQHPIEHGSRGVDSAEQVHVTVITRHGL